MTRVKQVQLTEVGMRDGFQMEAHILPTSEKIEIGLALLAAGITHLEATSFVSAKAIPQLADATELIRALKGRGAELNALVPNANGARRAISAGVDRMTVFVSASETHNIKNVRRTIAQSLDSLAEIGSLAVDSGVAISGGVATAFGCPFEGDVEPDAVLRVVDALVNMGANSINLGDTTGMATPPIVTTIVNSVRKRFPELPLSLHFHNTRGLGLVNVMAGLELGIDRYESSIGGLGGCPFAPGASGNVSTEDLVYMLDELGIESGASLAGLINAARLVEMRFGRSLPGQVMKAGPRLRDAETADSEKV